MAKNRTPIWKTKDGKCIPIDKMPDIHLANAIAYLRREAVNRFLKLRSLTLKGVWDAADLKPKDFLPEIYYELVKEWDHRHAAVVIPDVLQGGRILEV